jgi:hypothetical protein
MQLKSIGAMSAKYNNIDTPCMYYSQLFNALFQTTELAINDLDKYYKALDK